MWLGLLQLIFGLVILVLGGEFLIQAAVRIARYFKVEPMIIGLTIVSFGTSFPELVVSLNAAFSGHPDISVGNVVGSNIANLALVLGLSTAIKPISISRDTVRLDWPILMAVSAMVVAIAWVWEFALGSGIMLVALLVGYNVLMVWRGKTIGADESIDQPIRSKGQLIRVILILVSSLVALIYGSEILVDGAVAIAEFWGVEESVIAVTIIAFGTSVPELATSLIAIKNKEAGIGIGNLIGSNIFNILGILGITALFKPLIVNDHLLNFDFWVCLLIPVILYPLLVTMQKMNRWMGILLLLTYVGYLLYFI
ncbi:MAG: calcium/sodium antiporter [Salibacteraceae bacterium]